MQRKCLACLSLCSVLMTLLAIGVLRDMGWQGWKMAMHPRMSLNESLSKLTLSLERLEDALNNSKTWKSYWKSTVLELHALRAEVEEHRWSQPLLCDECNDLTSAQEVTTLLLYPDPSMVDYLLTRVIQTYPNLRVRVAVNTSQSVCDQAAVTTLVTCVDVSNVSSTSAWNMLREHATTPFLLIGQGLIDFDRDVLLDRQLQVIKSTGAAAVGGTSIHVTGHWKLECYQFHVGGYTLKVTEQQDTGMFLDCWKCHWIGWPFLTRKQSFSLEETLPEKEAFMNFFLTLTSHNSSLFLLCPDVKYMTEYSSFSNLKRSTLIHLASLWKFDTLSFPGRTLYFGSEDVGVRCGFQITLKGYGLPRCCIREHLRGLRTLSEFFDYHNISHHLNHGALLAAVKLGHFSPWDIDTDIRIDSKGFQILEKHKKSLDEKGLAVVTLFSLGIPSNQGQAFVLSGGLNIEVWEMNVTEATEGIPESLISKLTSIKMGSLKIKSPGNPGYYVRRRYGPGHLKHAQSWRADKHYNGRYHTGKFLSCKQHVTTCPHTIHYIPLA